MKFQEHFDAILCINLADRPDRWIEAMNESIRVGIDFGKMQRVQATPHRNGHAGAALSHVGIWRALAAGEYGTGDASDRVLILEDDFMLMTPWELVRAGYPPDSHEVRIFSAFGGYEREPAEYLSTVFGEIYREVVRDWDILFLGGGYQQRPFGLVSSHVVRTAGMLGMHAYAITRSAATSMVADLANLYHRDDWPLAFDCTFMLVFAKHMGFYVTSPRFFVQRPSRSSIMRDAGTPTSFASSYVDAQHELTVGR